MNRPRTQTAPRASDGRATPEGADLQHGILLAWALLVVLVFLLQPSTTDVLASLLLPLLGGGD
jgi:hypothetical protein